MAVQHGQQHGQAVPIEAHTQAAGAGAATVNQCLDLHQQRPRAFQRHHDAAARHRFGMLAQENGAGVADAFQAFFGHGEHANFIHRAKAVFDGPHQPIA